ncbi:MAG TPA: alkaline phosphatase D family protein, partial [Pseudohongiella sp.]|nr:alkaline phosphatase D family protein [Pseudohongiella sp.]
MLRFLRFRSMDVLIKLPRWLQKLLLPGRTLAIRNADLYKKQTRTAWEQLREFWRIAGLQSEPRYLEYEFSYKGASFSGRKTLAYGINRHDMLAALMTLPMDVRAAGKQKQRMNFELDAVRVTDGPSMLQITSSPDLSSSVLAAGGFLMYALRMIMNTHFWSFAAPAYKQFAKREDMETAERQGRYFVPPEVIYYGPGGKQQSTRREQFEHCLTQNEGAPPRPLARLVRYQPASGDASSRRALLLVHGLAHSGRVFWTDTIPCNFVQYFLEQNYDVWVLDHRVSANYIRDLTKDDRWDDIALDDIPWAVKTIFRQINLHAQPGQEKHVHVFSHCIGAGAVAMSVLAGKLNYKQKHPNGVERSMLASLVPHAVTPWLHTSAENRARANVWAWVKELEPIKFIEPMPHNDPSLLEMVYDRLAALAMTEDERKQWSRWRSFRDWRGPGFAQSIYTRYTIFWGRQWHNNNMATDTRYEFAGMIGPVPIGVMQQVYFSLTRGLLSDHEGGNSYVREAAFEKYWQFPTLFLHGNRNTVFDQESSRHSADQLTRLRIRQSTGQRFDGELKPEDYARQQVWIEVLNDYGHMDMIFSKTACRDVFPRLHAFFDAAENQTMEKFGQCRLTAPGARDWFDLQCRARSAVVPSHRPRTGPVISSPRRLSGNRLAVRIWTEAEDFSVYSAEGVLVKPAGKSRPLPVHHLGWQGLQTLSGYSESLVWPTEFWLHDLELPLPLNDDLLLSIRMPGDVTSGAHSATPEHEQVLLEWKQLPWFRRAAVADDTPGSLSLLLGSCLYPGLPFERDRSFNAFHAIRQHIFDDLQYGRGADGLLLLGDQIYADATADLFDPRAPYERYRNPYRTAFNQPDVAYVLSHLPTWFVVDDHEYRDNWHGLEEKDKQDEYRYARRMAGLYQMHQVEDWHAGEARLWYDFRCA